MEFSKKITAGVLIFQALVIITAALCQIYLKIDIESLLNFTTPLTISSLTGYLAKSGVENYTKIKTNPIEEIEIESEISNEDV